jgi:cytochrome P450
VFPTGDLWKKHRKWIQPGFGPIHLRYTSKISLEKAKLLVDRLKDLKSVDIQHWMTLASLDILGMVVFGHEFNYLLGNRSRINFELLLNVPLKRVLVPRILWPLFGLATHSRQITNFRNELHDLMNTLATERLICIQSGQSDDDMKDVMYRLLKLYDSGEITREELFGELVGFFIAGHETTSSTLTFAIMEICQNEEVQSKLFDVLQHIPLDDETTLDQIQRCEYLDWVVKETQRLHSVIGSISRTSLYSCTIGGYTFPPGTDFVAYIRGIHLDPVHYTNPQMFVPERWKEPMKPMTFLPFGDGIHNCIGSKMALIEMKCILTTLIQSFRMKMTPNQTITPNAGITLRLSSGLHVAFEVRN